MPFSHLNMPVEDPVLNVESKQIDNIKNISLYTLIISCSSNE